MKVFSPNQNLDKHVLLDSDKKGTQRSASSGQLANPGRFANYNSAAKGMVDIETIDETEEFTKKNKPSPTNNLLLRKRTKIDRFSVLSQKRVRVLSSQVVSPVRTSDAYGTNAHFMSSTRRTRNKFSEGEETKTPNLALKKGLTSRLAGK